MPKGSIGTCSLTDKSNVPTYLCIPYQRNLTLPEGPFLLEQIPVEFIWKLMNPHRRGKISQAQRTVHWILYNILIFCDSFLFFKSSFPCSLVSYNQGPTIFFLFPMSQKLLHILWQWEMSCVQRTLLKIYFCFFMD